MHPLLDLSDLTDAQLIEKIALTSSRVMAVRKSGQSCSIVDQLKMVLLACQDELALRAEPPVNTETVAWDMDSYLEQNKHDIAEQQQEDIPRWKSAALNELSDDSDSPWG